MLDRELKRGSTEMLILALVEAARFQRRSRTFELTAILLLILFLPGA